MNNLNPDQQPTNSPAFDEGGKPALASCIGEEAIRFCDGTCYGTDGNGALNIGSTCEKSGYPGSVMHFHKNETASSILLRDSKEVAKWVHEMAAKQRPGTSDDFSITGQLIRAAVLAIYPGYFTPNDTDARRCTVLNRFFDGSKISGGEYATRAVLAIIRHTSATRGQKSLLRTLQKIPTPLVATLAAHGLPMLLLWNERWEEAIISGCVYQLTHPAEKYYAIASTSGNDVQVPLILQSRLEEKQAVFRITGLTQEDVDDAESLAMVMDSTKGHDYVSSFLHYLNSKSTIAGDITVEPALELPTMC